VNVPELMEPLVETSSFALELTVSADGEAAAVPSATAAPNAFAANPTAMRDITVLIIRIMEPP